MASSYLFTVTQSGISALNAAQQGGVQLNVKSFSIGSGFGYTPSTAQTGLMGTVLYSSTISNYSIDSNGYSVFTLYLGADVGNFSFGEIGLYLASGALFAVAVLSTVQEKVVFSLNSPGNVITLKAKIAISNIAPYISWTNPVVSAANAITVPSLTSLGTPQAASSNFFAVLSGDDQGNTILAIATSNNIWSFSTHSTIVAAGSVGAGTTATTVYSQASNIAIPAFAINRYILQYTSGALLGLAFYVTGINTDGSVLIGNGGNTAPAVGDSFSVYQSNVYTLNSANSLGDDSFMYAILFS